MGGSRVAKMKGEVMVLVGWMRREREGSLGRWEELEVGCLYLKNRASLPVRCENERRNEEEGWKGISF